MRDEYEALRSAYKESDRLAPPPNECAPISKFEVGFAIPVFLSDSHQESLQLIISDIVDSPFNEPINGVHWLAGSGSKPSWSRIDCAVLGKTPEPDAPIDGEPTFDDEILYFESSARSFVSTKERDRVLGDRVKIKTPRDRESIRANLDCIETILRESPDVWVNADPLFARLRKMLRFGKYEPPGQEPSDSAATRSSAADGGGPA